MKGAIRWDGAQVDTDIASLVKLNRVLSKGLHPHPACTHAQSLHLHELLVS